MVRAYLYVWSVLDALLEAGMITVELLRLLGAVAG